MSKVNELAQILLDHSLEVKPHTKIVVRTSPIAKDLNKEIIKEATKRQVYVELQLNDDDYTSLLLKNKENNLDLLEKDIDTKGAAIDGTDGLIVINTFQNEFNAVNVDSTLKMQIAKISRKYQDKQLAKPWILLNYPSHAFAQKAQMEYDEYVDFCYSAMCVDYKALNKKLQPLKDLMDKTNHVKIIGPNTNLEFSIKDIPTIICSGENNIPDGEIFTAPVKNSVNGTIKFNTYSIEHGKRWDNIFLEFKDGKIIKALCDNATEAELNEIFDMDDGARYVGEFSLGVNNEIKQPIGDILYDEKIGGSFHFTPGSSYDNAFNGNKSALHWDLVCLQDENSGGGEIYFDNVLIRKNGKFLLPELKELNN